MVGLESVPENRPREDPHQDRHPNVPPPREIGWAERNQFLLVVLAGIIMYVISRAVTNPPGGLWKKNGVLPDNTKYEAGKSKLTYIWPDAYLWLMAFMSGAFFYSCSVVMLLTCGMHVLMRKTFACIAIVWIAFSFVSLVYIAALQVLIYYEDVADAEDERICAVLSMIPFLGLVMFLALRPVWRKVVGIRTDNPTASV